MNNIVYIIAVLLFHLRGPIEHVSRTNYTVREIDSVNDIVVMLEYTPDLKYQAVRVWTQACTESRKVIIDSVDDLIMTAGLVAGNKLLFVKDRDVEVLDYMTGQYQHLIRTNTRMGVCAMSSGLGSILSANDKSLQFWDVKGGKRGQLARRLTSCESIAIAPDGRRAALVDDEMSVMLVDIEQMKIINEVRDLGTIKGRVGFSYNGSEVWVCVEPSTIVFADVNTGIIQGSIEGHTAPVCGASHENGTMAFIDVQGTVSVWRSRASATPVLCFRESGGRGSGLVAISKGGESVAIGRNILKMGAFGNTRVARVAWWNIERKKCTKRLEIADTVSIVDTTSEVLEGGIFYRVAKAGHGGGAGSVEGERVEQKRKHE